MHALYCDCGRVAYLFMEGTPIETARERAAAGGWSTEDRDGVTVDVCPNCTAERNTPEP